MKIQTRFLLLLILFMALSGCRDAGVPPPPAEPGFAVQTLFARSCAESGCHSADAARTGEGGGLALDSWSSVFNGSSEGAMVVPYRARQSHLFQHINRDSALSPIASPQMPLGRDPLSPADIDRIYTWIQSGAMRDDGKVAFEDATEKFYVSNQSADYIAVMDKASGLVMRYIDVSGSGGVSGGRDAFGNLTSALNSPHYIELDHGKNFWYVSLITRGEVWKFDATTDRFVGKVSCGSQPAHIVISPNDSALYVSNFDQNANSVTVINTATMTVKTVIQNLTSAPHGLALTADGRTLFTAGSASGFVYKINTETFAKQLITLKLPSEPTRNLRPYQVMLSPDENKLYISCNGDASYDGDLRVIDLTLAFPEVVKVLQTGKYPMLMDFTPDKQTLYIVSRNSNSVSSVRVSTDEVIATVSNIGIQPHGIRIGRDGLAYISNESLVGFTGHHPTEGGDKTGNSIVLDTKTNTVVKAIEMQGFPAGVMLKEK